ncbi:MAG: right-handed parallel beta-helix repeat-containing protein, partial [Myxococcota bacterium]
MTSPVTITAELGVDNAATATVSVIPPLLFAGISNAIAIDENNVVVSFQPATGGQPPYTYTVYRSAVEGVLGTAEGMTLTTETSATYSIADVMTGNAVFYTVQVADSLASDLDNNLVQASVLKGPVRFVDATNTGTANGGPGTPYTTLLAAVASLPNGGTINISAAPYSVLPRDFSTSPGIQFVGGFSGFVDSNTTATDWVRGETNTGLEYDGVSVSSGALLRLGDGSVLSGFDVGAAYTGSDNIVQSTGRLEIRDSVLGSTDVANTATRIDHTTGGLSLIDTAVLAASTGLTCVRSVDGIVTLSGVLFDGCSMEASVSVDPAVSVTVRSSTFQNGTEGLSVTTGTATIRNATFDSIAGEAITLVDADLDVDASTFRDGSTAVSVNGLGGVVFTRSEVTNMRNGLSGSIRSAAGERRPVMIQNNVFETTQGSPVNLGSNGTTGVYDVDVRGNTFVWLGSGNETGLDLDLSNEEPMLSGALMVLDNVFLDFANAIDVFVREGNNAGDTDVALVADFSNNYGRSSFGYGKGIDALF